MTFPQPNPNGTCIVTGASSGIGAEIARNLAGRGYNVTLVARREALLQELSRELSVEQGVDVDFIACDVTTAEGRNAIAEHAERDDRRPFALINCAGFASAGDVLEVDEAALLEIVNVNVSALVSLTRKIAPLMIDQGYGAILNVASTASFQPMPHEATYAASKAFVLHFTEALGRELKGTGVTCTTLCPGPTATDFAAIAGLQEALDELPSFAVSKPRAVAETGVTAMIRGRRTRTHGSLNRIGAVLGRYSPSSIVLRVVDALWPRPAA
ncbi:MAG: SDR family NAD(P)-dependent oxidoreductase [Solirubrobacterales bacterium]